MSAFKGFVLMMVLAAMTSGLAVLACGGGDDDDNDDAADDDNDDDDLSNVASAKLDDDDDNDDDDDDDDDDTGQICKNENVIDPLPDPGMTPDALCTSCHDNTVAQRAHAGVYDAGAPGSCMANFCHACP